MKRINTWSGGQQVESAHLNSIQDRAIGAVAAGSNNHLSAMADGMQAVEWQYASNLATATEVKVDGTALSSWLDRIVIVLYRGYGTANRQPGAIADYLYDSTTLYLAKGYTGNGALNLTHTAEPSNGDPPFPAGNISWATQLTTNVWLYAKASDGALYLYNDTGAAIECPNLTVFATADTTKR